MADDRSEQTSHGDYVPTADEFAASRSEWRTSLSEDEGIRRQAVALQVSAERHHFTYQWEWAGVPIIRLPDDVMVLQEIFWHYRPQKVVETGVARGGSVLLDASLMRLCGEDPSVLGIDHKLYPHARAAVGEHPLGGGVTLMEADSASSAAADAVKGFLGGADRAVLILDSNHTHEHVLAELRALTPALPSGSFVLVADTLIEEFPAGHFTDRPWDRGNNPLTAVRTFLAEEADFVAEPGWSRRALLSEFRDGIIRRAQH